MEKISRLISVMFSPLLVPTYAMVLTLIWTILFIVSTNTKLGVLAMTASITCLFPLLAIILLYKLKVISEPGLNNRKERFIPYVVTLVSYIGFAFYLSKIHSPLWLVSFPCGASLAVVISFLVNLKWKISAHGAAVGGLAGYIFCLIYFQLFIIHSSIYYLYAAIFIAGLVGTSRVILKRHTVPQVIAGTINGFICVILSIFLFH